MQFSLAFTVNEILTLGLWLADKLANRTWLFALDGQQISLHDSTIVPQMVDKLAELIIHAKHEWSIKQPRNCQPLKDEK